MKINKQLASICALALLNGALYFAIAIEGGQNLLTLFHVQSNGHTLIDFTSALACLVYTMFTYKTLETASLRPKTPAHFFFSVLSFFSAAAFLTAGRFGAELLGCSTGVATLIGLALFALRMINCVDASVKFPERLTFTWNAYQTARQTGNKAELTRLAIISFTSLVYSAATTDAVYNAIITIGSWMNVAPNNSTLMGLSYFFSILGALGTLPLIVYWSHRGLRQLTFGGQKDQEGKNLDPTDRYTFLGWLCATPVLLGILGSATGTNGMVFGQLGGFAHVLRLISAVFYTSFAATPGMATLWRKGASFFNGKGPTNNHDLEAGNTETSPTSYQALNSESSPSSVSPRPQAKQ